MQTAELQLLLACTAMAALTFVVLVRLFYVRLREMSARRIDPQSIGTAAAAGVLRDARASDNLRNLFEVPVLLYALAALALAADAATPLLAAGAWLFVALRAVHSAIACTDNQVVHRFAIYAVSTLVLMAMWAALAIELRRRM